MLGPGAKCVTANTAAAVLLPWAGWAGEGSAEVHFPGTQGRRFEPTHSARDNGLDSYLLEIFLRQCIPCTLRVWTGLCLLPVDDSETWLQEEHAVNSVGGSPRFLCDPRRAPQPRSWFNICKGRVRPAFSKAAQKNRQCIFTTQIPRPLQVLFHGGAWELVSQVPRVILSGDAEERLDDDI